MGLTITLAKGAFQALAVIYPSYKTYKALESRSLRAAQAMLLYWTITAFVNSIKEFADQLLGTYANFIVWKLMILTLKAAPLIIGPDRLYDAIVKPLFEKHEEKIDAAVGEVHKIREIAKDAVPAVKAGDIDTTKEKAAEIVDLVTEEATELVHAIQQQALELTENLQAKSAEIGVEWDTKGLAGLTDRTIEQFERLRDAVIGFASVHWQRHGPLVKKQANIVREKSVEYYPVAREKTMNIYSNQIAPRMRPLVQRYNESIKPALLSKRDQVAAVWDRHGGPVRKVYVGRVRPFLRGTLQPFMTEKFIPWLIDSFLPAVYETIISLKDRLTDLASTPSDETRAHRIHHKRRRAENIEARREHRRVKKSESSSSSSSSASGDMQEQSHHRPLYKRQKTSTDTDISSTDKSSKMESKEQIHKSKADDMKSSSQHKETDSKQSHLRHRKPIHHRQRHENSNETEQKMDESHMMKDDQKEQSKGKTKRVRSKSNTKPRRIRSSTDKNDSLSHMGDIKDYNLSMVFDDSDWMKEAGKSQSMNSSTNKINESSMDKAKDSMTKANDSSNNKSDIDSKPLPIEEAPKEVWSKFDTSKLESDDISSKHGMDMEGGEKDVTWASESRANERVSAQ